MKKLLIIVIALINMYVLSSCGIYRNKMTVQTFDKVDYNSNNIKYSPIIWHSDSIGGNLIEKTRLYIPVKLNGINKTVYMQFDLGIPTTRLYGNTLDAFAEKNPSIKEKIVKTEDQISYFHDARIDLKNNISLTAKKLPIINYGSNSIDTSFSVIGSTGYDFIGDNILILDFKEDQYSLTVSLSRDLKEKVKYIDNPDLAKFPVILPFRLGNKKIRLMYDSGASLFSILTGTNRLEKLSQASNIDTIGPLNSWGNQQKYYRISDADKIYFNKQNLGKIDVYGREDLNKFKLTGRYLYGITGNKLFDNKIIIIDRKNNKFGIVE